VAISGIELLQRAVAHDSDLVCIIITGYATVELAVQAIKQGAYDFISKPFDGSSLLLRVRQGLAHRRLSLEAQRLARVEEEKEALQRRMDEMEKEALKQRTADLERLDRIKSDFTRTVAHELRAPIAAVQSYLRLLLDGYIAQEKHSEYLNRAVDCTEAELALIGDLMDLAHLQSPDLSPKHELVDVVSSLQEVCVLLQPTAEERGVQLTASLPQPVHKVLAEPKHMRQLWDNLVSNAIKYTPPGGEVQATMTKDADRVKVTVRDTGIGMSPEEMEHIFEEFYRSKPAKESDAIGTGLGLAIVKRIVDTYQGRIDVESEPGIGSTFTVTLPVAS